MNFPEFLNQKAKHVKLNLIGKKNHENLDSQFQNWFNVGSDEQVINIKIVTYISLISIPFLQRGLADDAVKALEAVHGTVFENINSADLCKNIVFFQLHNSCRHITMNSNIFEYSEVLNKQAGRITTKDYS